MMKNNSITAYLVDKNPWKDNPNPIWLASSINFFRNLSKFNFPHKLPTDRQKVITSLISEELLKNQMLKIPKLFGQESIEPAEREFISERFLASEGLFQAHGEEAFVFDETGTFMATINLQDHLHLQLMTIKGELLKSWSYLMKIETELGKTLNYAFSSRFGFLTSDQSLCGTALQVNVFLQLPGLIHTEIIDDVLEEVTDESLLITGLHGNPTEVIGDILVIKNGYTLGVTEDSILSNLETLVAKLITKENTSRKEIKASQNSEIKDRISRAYAILIHSYQIEAVEALNALSLLKLGVDLGWVEGLSLQEINMLFFTCRRAHFLCYFEKPFALEEIPHRRAEFIHQSLSHVKLKI